jgi:ubiquinone/menaquinone biosynthesis C-methylase UbiE
MPVDYKNIPVGGGDTFQPLAMDKRLKYIGRHLKPDGHRFLDCGCGAGGYVFQLVDRFGLDAVGIEYEEEKVQRGKLHPQHGHRIAKGDIQALPFNQGEFDYALLNEVLEHVPDDAAALREVFRTLKPHGLLFIFSPNRWYPFETHGVNLKQSNRHVPYWVPFIPYIPLALGTRFLRYWARNYGQRDLQKLVLAAGFSIVEVSFVWQTFEDISGHQPRIVGSLKPLLRNLVNRLETTPFLQRFGVSQAVLCRKP